MAVNLHSTHFRFGIDELAENTHGWHAAEDANPAQGVIAEDSTFLLRFTVQETGGSAAGNVDIQFQCRLNGGTWQDITTTSTIVKAVAAVPLTNGGNCTKRLSGTGTFESSGAGQTEDGSSGGNANDIAASGNSETECGLQIVGADTSPGDLIEFRLTSPDFTITNDVLPGINLAAAAGIAATLDRTLGAASLSSAVANAIAGISAQSLAAVSIDADGSVAEPSTAAALDQSLGALGIESGSASAIEAAGASALGTVTLASSGEVAIAASATMTLAQITLLGAASVAIGGSVSHPLGAIVISAQGGDDTRSADVDQALGTVELAAGATVSQPGIAVHTPREQTTRAVLWAHRGSAPVMAIYPDDVDGAAPLKRLSIQAGLAPVQWVHRGSSVKKAMYPDDCGGARLRDLPIKGGEAEVFWFCRGTRPATAVFPDDCGGLED